MKLDPKDPKHLDHLMRLYPKLAPNLLRVKADAMANKTDNRAAVLLGSQEIKSAMIADLIEKIPGLRQRALRMAKAFEGLDSDNNMEAALRASVMEYLAPVPAEVGDQMELLIRLLECGLCLIDWTVVADRVFPKET